MSLDVDLPAQCYVKYTLTSRTFRTFHPRLRRHTSFVKGNAHWTREADGVTSPLDLSMEKRTPCRSRMLHFMGKVGFTGKKDVGGII